MSDAVIRVEGIGKRYRVGERESYRALRDVLSNAFRSNGKPASKDFIWAVRDVSFEVKQGEVVGLIGRNGAGKSTLLKLLARITRPTVGHAELHGRIGSLLEVGTGFHPELTGRENIFLSGAILGMSKAEIVRKFDEIVAFSEVERFIDTPLKHYSSGMGMRLAFAVAAHLEPEILLVDEVLSVGDASFQKKCLGKMQDVSRAGRTILFVSHNMGAVTALCARALMLEGGEIILDGPTSETVTCYYAGTLGNIDSAGDLTSVPRIGSGTARFTSISIHASSSDGPFIPVAETGCDLTIKTEIEAHSDLPESNVAVIIYDSAGYRLIDVNLNQQDEFLRLSRGEKASVSFQLRQLLLKPATYRVGLWIGRGGIEEIDGIDCAATFEVAPNAASQVHPFVFPGPYLCSFEKSVTIFHEEISAFTRSMASIEREASSEP